MNEYKSLSELLVDGYEMAQFNKKVQAEREGLKHYTYEDLLISASTLRAYIKYIHSVGGSEIDLLTQAYKNGLNKAKGDEHRKKSHAANKGHIKDLDKQNTIRKIWETGKYSSRDICAEQECAALKMSFSTARKALRNTPNNT